MTFRPIFLPTAPERKPRTECGCQPVAFMSSFSVTPPACLSRSRTWAVLLPSRAFPALALPAFLGALAPFFGGLALLAALALDGATCARRVPPEPFLARFGVTSVV